MDSKDGRTDRRKTEKMAEKTTNGGNGVVS